MVKGKKIAFVINTLKSGGAERVVTILANHLVKENQILIITLSKMTPFYPLDKSIKHRYCKAEIPPSKNILQSVRSNITLARRIHSLLKEEEIELCIGFMTTSNILTAWAASRMRIPVIISERNNPQFEDRQLSRFWKVLRKISYPKADRIVVQTKGICDYFLSSAKKNNYHIIPNPINPDFDRSGPSEKENIILNVGRLADQKGQDLLIRAFAALNKRDWQLHIIGEGPRRKDLEALVVELDVQDCVFLPGRTHQIESYYKRSKIFAFTSYYEGFPNALLEAMYFGLACMSTDCPTGPSELIEDGHNGLLVPVGEQEPITRALQRLIDCPQERLELGRHARLTTQQYTASTIALEWEKLIGTLLR